MMSAMRLLFVIKSLSVEAGGAERVLCEICSELARRGHSVEIASFDQPGTSDFYRLDSRVERTRLAIGNVHQWSRMSEFVPRVSRLRSLLGERQPDAAIGFMHSAFVALAIGGWGTGIPVVASEHSSRPQYRQRGFEILLVRAIAPLCSAFTTTLEDVRSEFPQGIAKRMEVISNPVPAAIKPRPRGASDGARKRLLFVGNFRPGKGHSTLVAAFARLAEAYPDWDLRLAGAGDLRGEIEQQVASLKLQSRVAFPGALADVAAEYAAADLFAIPSVHESFGLATAEALASGLAVVGFADCSGTCQLVEDGRNGILVRGRDRVEALASGLERLMSSAELRHRLGQAGPESVRQYSVDSVAGRWEELLGAVAGQATLHRESTFEGRHAVK